jgi:methyl-accepting chemotaxis protein
VPNTTEVVTVVVAVFTGGGLVSAIEAIRHRGRDRADTTATISAAAEGVVKMLQEVANQAKADADEARREAAEARTTSRKAGEEANGALQQMHQVRHEMEVMAYRFRRLTGAILDDDVTRTELKLMVRSPTPEGGN